MVGSTDPVSEGPGSPLEAAFARSEAQTSGGADVSGHPGPPAYPGKAFAPGIAGGRLRRSQTRTGHERRWTPSCRWCPAAFKHRHYDQSRQELWIVIDPGSAACSSLATHRPSSVPPPTARSDGVRTDYLDQAKRLPIAVGRGIPPITESAFACVVGVSVDVHSSNK